MKNVQSYFIVFVLLIFAGISCSDSGTNTQTDDSDNDNNNSDENTTVQGDIDHIEQSIDQATSSLRELGQGKFSDAVETFLDANSGMVNSEQWINKLGSGLEDVLDTRSIRNNSRFDFAAHTGIYEWNSYYSQWIKSSNSDKLVLKFPSSKSSSSNDMTFTISEYSDTALNIDNGTVYLPTRLQSNLEKDGNTIFGFNLNEVNYSNSEIPIPNTLDVEIITAPFTHSLTFNKDRDNKFSFTFEVSKDEELVTKLSSDIELSNGDYSNLDQDDFERATASINISKNLSVEVDAELASLITTSNPSENEINSSVDAEVNYKENKIADLEYSKDDQDIVIVYKDGSSETTDRYYDDFIEDFEQIFYTFTGDWIDNG